MRLWENRMNPAAISAPAMAPAQRLWVRRRAKHHISGTSITPNSVPAQRQPKAVIPKIAMPSMIKSLPSGGWVVSYAVMRCSISYPVRP